MTDNSTTDAKGNPLGRLLVYRPACFQGSLDFTVCVTQTGYSNFTGAGVDVPGNQTGFNLGLNVQEDPQLVGRRRQEVQNEMASPVLWLKQVHGVRVFDADQWDGVSQPEADASVTSRKDLSLSVLTADCLPVVMIASWCGQSLAIAVAHAGWKGLVAGVLDSAYHALLQKSLAVLSAKARADREAGAGDTVRSELSALVSQQDGQLVVRIWLGPAIGPESFEVGPDVKQAFDRRCPLDAQFFKQGRTSLHWMADLYGLAKARCGRLSGDVPLEVVTEVIGEELTGHFDTRTDSRWFSHRRSVSEGEPQGRFATLVRLLP